VVSEEVDGRLSREQEEWLDAAMRDLTKNVEKNEKKGEGD